MRLWIHDVFLPEILPDFLEACERVADAFVKNGKDEAKQVVSSLGVKLMTDFRANLGIRNSFPDISPPTYLNGPDTLQ